MNKHQPKPIKQWFVHQEGEKEPSIIRANSLRQRDNGYTLVADGVQIPLSKKITKIELDKYV